MALLRELERHLAQLPWPDGLLFGRTKGTPFGYIGIKGRARRRWAEQGLQPITPPEARHTYASLMIAAGRPQMELAESMVHASVAITLDRYGQRVRRHAPRCGPSAGGLPRRDAVAPRRSPYGIVPAHPPEVSPSRRCVTSSCGRLRRPIGRIPLRSRGAGLGTHK
jgi:Phage integrase family